MNKRIICLLPFLLWFIGELAAEVPDSTLRWVSYLDTRSSFIDKRRVNVRGANAGMAWGKQRHELTVGYYWVGYQATRRLIELDKDRSIRIHPDYYTKTDLHYLSLMLWHNFVNTRRWQLSLPVEVGLGRARSFRQSLTVVPVEEASRRHLFVPVQVGGYAEWKATRWIGLGLQAGYRWAVYDSHLRENFNGSYYSVGAVFYSTFFYEMRDFIFRKKPLRSPFHTRRATTPSEPSQY
ncbi:hypothetical protein [Telluribacter humicola]|uniref:hypothetical protein n=1 Tax=Telluribacter humicola TaxID=1720261 RepID=UPI001A97AC47|nr:hypothetical protein [Telluribacter humicola]